MKRKLISLMGNTQWLDGGAMFGNVPKALWSKWVDVNSQNRIELACRCLLVREQHDDGRIRNILLEAGIGAFFAPAMRDRYGVTEQRHVLLDSLAAHGINPDEIDVVVLSHLHFDHAGGLLAPWADGHPLELVFNRAKYIVSARAWERACNPHPRDRASFIPELPFLLEKSERLILAEGPRCDVLGDDFRFHYSDGHTPGLLMTEVILPAEQGGSVLYVSDLVPGAAWVHLPVTMGYDRNPELLIDEKAILLSKCAQRGIRLFFAHDPKMAVARIINENGKFRAVA